MLIWEAKLRISVQGQPYFTVTELDKLLMIACGGHLSPSYFMMREMEISDCLYHLYLYIDQQNEKANKQQESKLAEWGFSEDQMEMV
ncbi:hypothetical protein [Nostoc sp. KVJ3]|uniref:hypothetical protein n=1 Tax=Nostoc sp. KVJ3 TaxID=457945 RepID=UPI00223854F6|nr:hypothetical protein [Nostoc sp. KVJ3]